VFYRLESELMFPALRRCWSCALVFALALHLVLGQGLGLAHRTAHGPHGAGVVFDVVVALEHVAGGHAHAGGHEHTEVCRLLDQAAHTDALVTAPGASSLPSLAHAVFAGPVRGRLHWHAVVYRARGPPNFLV
jgi:hypothetical protein